MHEEPSSSLIPILERIERRIEKIEEPVISLREGQATINARLSAIEKANETERSRASDDRAGARSWVTTAGGWILGVFSIILSLFLNFVKGDVHK